MHYDSLCVAVYFAASRLLPLGLFGLLGYVEPILLAIVSIFFLHETISDEQIFAYCLIWSAVAMLILEGMIHVLKNISRRIKQTAY